MQMQLTRPHMSQRGDKDAASSSLQMAPFVSKVARLGSMTSGQPPGSPSLWPQQAQPGLSV